MKSLNLWQNILLFLGTILGVAGGLLGGTLYPVFYICWITGLVLLGILIVDLFARYIIDEIKKTNPELFKKKDK